MSSRQDLPNILAGQKRKYISISDPLARQETGLERLDVGPLLEGPKLCAACSSLNFDSIFTRGVRDWRGRLVKDLGLITQEWKTRDCELCRLWMAMRPIISGKEDDQRYQHFHLRAYSSMRSFVDTFDGLTCRAFPRLTDTIFLSVVVAGSERSGSQREIHTWWKKTTQDTGFVGLVPTHSSSLSLGGTGYSGQPIKANAVDYQLLRYWIEYCEREHIRKCDTRYVREDEKATFFRVPEDEKVPPFRVIDCEARSPVVVEVDDPRTCCYLALSYVWGTQKEKQEKCHPEANGNPAPGLPDYLPSVIQDAITVTKELGHRYLWVDRYCINQNPKELNILVRNMDRIYSHAFVCLIAAAGSDPSFGLPGVGKCSRTPQPCAMIGDRALVSTMPILESELRSTTWITRGWTYQEVLLSKRRLFFMQKQVYFECNVMYCCEAVQRPLDALHHSKKEELRSELKGPIFASQLQYVWEVISEYTSKCLTKPEDVLSGISGIFGWYMRLPQPLYHICGIPFSVQHNTEVPRTQNFVLNLFWQHEEGLGPSRRRHGFPSWSWSGWFGRVSELSRRSGRVATEVEVWLQVNLEQLSIDGWVRLENIQKAIEGRIHESNTTKKRIEYIAGRLALCHTLRIKALSMQVRLMYNPLSTSKWLALLGDPCGHCAATAGTEFFLTKAADEDEKFRMRLQSDSFTGLILSHTDRTDQSFAEPYCPSVLVVDWQDEKQTIAERIGFFCIRSTLVRVDHTCGRKFNPSSIPTSEREVIMR